MWRASKTEISLGIEKTLVDIMKKITEHYQNVIVSLSDLQFYAKEKFLRDQLSGRTREFRHHILQRVDAVSAVLNLDEFPSEDGAFFDIL